MKYILIHIFLLTLSLFADDVTTEVKYLIDKHHNYDIKNIYTHKNKFTTMEKTSFGLSDNTIWVYAKIENNSSKDLKYVAHFPYALLDNLHILKYKNNTLYKSYLTGDLYPFSSREIQNYDFVIPSELDSGEIEEIFIKVNTSGAYNLGLKVLPQEEYRRTAKIEIIILGLYYGAVVIMLLYNFILYLIIKDNVYIDYIIFHFSFLFLQLGLNGLAFEFFWANTPQINLFFVPVALVVANYFSIQFSQSFLQIANFNIRWEKFFILLKFLWIITFILVFITPYFVSIKIIALLSIIGVSSLFLGSIYIFIKFKTVSAKFYVVAWSFLLVGVLSTEFQNIGLLPVSYFTLYGSQIGAFFELALLSFALAYRYNTLFVKLSHTEKELRVLNRNLEQKIDERTKQLQDLNDVLEQKIAKAVQETKQSEKMLQEQSKLASMGEMINNIAHQWRQPLAISNTIVSILKQKNKRGLLEKEYIDKKLDEIEIHNLYMSQTIEDFLSYFNPKKKKEEFNLKQIVDKSLLIVDNLLQKQKIEVEIFIQEDINLFGHKDEYIQVVLSLLTNAIQALKNTPSPKIIIKGSKDSYDTVFLVINDNAGGIHEEIIDRVFEPYFTTKHQNQGTGLGLYISKMIIEKSMNGKLYVQNNNLGAKFTIAIDNKDKNGKQ